MSYFKKVKFENAKVETDSAILFTIGGKDMWVPLSAISSNPETDGWNFYDIIIIVKAWFFYKMGLAGEGKFMMSEDEEMAYRDDREFAGYSPLDRKKRVLEDCEQSEAEAELELLYEKSDNLPGSTWRRIAELKEIVSAEREARKEKRA